MTDLSKNILQTIIYYDILSYPLTSFELWKYLTVARGSATAKEKCSLGDIATALESAELKKDIREFRGFYFLRGRRSLVGQRLRNDKNSILKYKIAARAAWWLRFSPFVRMVAVTGTVAMKNCEKDSDVDFLVILERGRIFTGRLLATLILHLGGLRRYGEKIKNRICLNYFATTVNLEIGRKDLFAASEYSFLYPLYGFETYKKFGEANSEWIKKYKPNYSFDSIEPFRHIRPGIISSFAQKTLEALINFAFGDRMETWLKSLQIRRIGRNPLTHKDGAYIEATDENLIFLPEPQSARVEKEFHKRLERLTL